MFQNIVKFRLQKFQSRLINFSNNIHQSEIRLSILVKIIFFKNYSYSTNFV